MIERAIGHKPLPEILSEAAVTTNVPILVVYTYAGEHLGFTDEIKDGIVRLTEVYKCEGVEE